MDNIEHIHTIEQFKAFLDANQFESKIVDDKDYEGKPYRYLDIQFPVARNTENIIIHEDDDLDTISNCGFVKYRGISDYEAIWSQELNCIECEVQDTQSYGLGRYIIRNLASYFETIQESTDDPDRNEPIECIIFSNDILKVSVGNCSKEFAFLSAYRDGRHIDIRQPRGSFRTTLKITNIAINTEENARTLLEKNIKCPIFSDKYSL